MFPFEEQEEARQGALQQLQQQSLELREVGTGRRTMPPSRPTRLLPTPGSLLLPACLPFLTARSGLRSWGRQSAS